MKLNCLIIDDEPIAQQIIERYIEPLDQLRVVGKCSDALEAHNVLMEQKVDLLFLDIEMPHINGLNFLKNLDRPPKVIITTAYREYALEGFEVGVTDYLLKPISQERFLKAVNRILSAPMTQKDRRPYIYLKVDLKMVRVFLDEILYIQGLSNYVRLFCEDRKLISYQKLSHLEEVLPGDEFIRSHRSFILNVSKVDTYTSSEVEIRDTPLPIGGSYKEKLMEILEKNEI